jgi:hypothetical protein
MTTLRDKVELFVRMLADRRLTDADIRVVGAEIFAFHNTKTGQCNPSGELIAKAGCKARSTVVTTNHKLATLGYCTIERSTGGKNKRNAYRFNWSAGANQTVVQDDSIDGETVAQDDSIDGETVVSSPSNCSRGRHQTVAGDDTHITREINTGRNTGISQAESVEDDAFDAYAALASELNLPIPRGIDRARRTKIRARLKERGLPGWQAALDEIQRSKFLRGEAGDWRITIDWLLAPANFSKVIEGNYRDGATPHRRRDSSRSLVAGCFEGD